MKRMLLVATVGALSAAGWCAVTVNGEEPSATTQPTTAVPGLAAPATQAGIQQPPDVRSIVLPQLAPDLPPGPGREAVNSACVICHSTRYITMQPLFPRKTWLAEVEKMRKVFGAPVSDPQAAEIVEYLVSVRGKPTPATQPLSR